MHKTHRCFDQQSPAARRREKIVTARDRLREMCNEDLSLDYG